MRIGGSVLPSHSTVIWARNGIHKPGTTVEHEEIYPGRDHLVRTRQMDCSCTVINLHYQPEGTLQEEPRRRLRAAAALWPTYPDGVGFSLATSIFATQPRVGSIPATRDGDTSRTAALLAAFPRSVVENAQLFFPRKTMGVTAPSTRCLALLAFSSIFRWLSCVISSAVPTRSGPLVISRYPAITSLSGSLSNVPQEATGPPRHPAMAFTAYLVHQRLR